MDIHELAKAAADATVPEDTNERVKTYKQMWFLARDAALFALEALEAKWHPIAEAPHACHVLACRLDDSHGEYIMAIVASPPTKPFTHFMMLPEGPKP